MCLSSLIKLVKTTSIIHFTINCLFRNIYDSYIWLRNLKTLFHLCSLPKLLCLDNDDYDDLDEAKSTVSSVAMGRKRHLSTSTGATSTAGPTMKYQGKVDWKKCLLMSQRCYAVTANSLLCTSNSLNHNIKLSLHNMALSRLVVLYFFFVLLISFKLVGLYHIYF